MPTSSPAAPPRAVRRGWARRGGALVAGVALALGLALGASPARATNPELAAAASLVLPGSGQAATGSYVAGATQFTLYFVLLNQYSKHIERPDYIPFDRREDQTNHVIRTNRTTTVADQYATGALDVAFYSSFSAYRDARAQPENAGRYRTPAPQETLGDLALAPLSWEYLKRPTTLAPLLLPLYLALAPVPRDRLVLAPDDSITRGELRMRYFFQHGAVAVGEEAFYRGFLNNGLSDRFGEGWGLAGSSALFGLSHSGQGGVQATALGAGLFGLYLGWVQQRNGYAIGENVAIHFWWNFLTSLALLKTHSGATVTPVQIYVRF